MRLKPVAMALALAIAMPGTWKALGQMVDIDGPDDGPMMPNIIMEDDGGSEVRTPLTPRVNQILIALEGSGAAGAKVRDDAEDKLVQLGPDALPLLKSLIAGHKGRGRDALVVATFRLENAPLSPRESIAGWVARKTGADPAAVIVQRVAADDLRKMFPNHLFYTASIKGEPSGKGAFPRTLLAIAADGKVQAIGDDASLANFLKHELPEGTGKTEQRRDAAAAAVLAVGRDSPDGADITSDGAVADSNAVGTAFVAGKTDRKTTVTLTFDPSGRVAGVVTQQPAPSPVEVKHNPPSDNDPQPPTPETKPATTEPALVPQPPDVRLNIEVEKVRSR